MRNLTLDNHLANTIGICIADYVHITVTGCTNVSNLIIIGCVIDCCVSSAFYQVNLFVTAG